MIFNCHDAALFRTVKGCCQEGRIQPVTQITGLPGYRNGFGNISTISIGKRNTIKNISAHQKKAVAGILEHAPFDRLHAIFLHIILLVYAIGNKGSGKRHAKLFYRGIGCTQCLTKSGICVRLL